MYPPIIDSMVRFLPAWLWSLVFIDSDLALGFLEGKEAQAAGVGNAGLRDREAHCSLLHHSTMLISHRALRVGMDPETHCCLRR
jgi:hypothetical protein